MSFASGRRELRGDVFSMLETHIEMSTLIFHLVLILMFCLAFTHVLCLALLLVLYLSSLMDPTISHMVLVHERTAFSLDALVMTHVLTVIIVSRVGLVFHWRVHPSLFAETLGWSTLFLSWFTSHSTKW
jgi:hypothetical protein